MRILSLFIIWPLFFLLIFVTVQQSQNEARARVQAQVDKQKVPAVPTRMVASSKIVGVKD